MGSRGVIRRGGAWGGDTTAGGDAPASATYLTSTDQTAALPNSVVGVKATGIYSSAGTDTYTSKVTGDSVERFVLNADGSMQWGSGSAALDTTLYRFGPNALGTDDDFVSLIDLYVRAGGANQIAVGLVGPGSTGAITFGNGDTNLYRNSAGVLKTDGAMAIAGNVGFYGTTPVAKPTGVAVTAAGIHAALVTLGLIAA